MALITFALRLQPRCLWRFHTWLNDLHLTLQIPYCHAQRPISPYPLSPPRLFITVSRSRSCRKGIECYFFIDVVIAQCIISNTHCTGTLTHPITQPITLYVQISFFFICFPYCLHIFLCSFVTLFVCPSRLREMPSSSFLCCFFSLTLFVGELC